MHGRALWLDRQPCHPLKNFCTPAPSNRGYEICEAVTDSMKQMDLLVLFQYALGLDPALDTVRSVRSHYSIFVRLVIEQNQEDAVTCWHHDHISQTPGVGNRLYLVGFVPWKKQRDSYFKMNLG